MKLPRPSTKLAKQHFEYTHNLIVCEIGVEYGENAISISRMLKPMEFYLVDPHPRCKGIGNYIKKNSDDALKDVPQCDFIYIDGDHRYSQIQRDLENYWKKVKKDGILAGHDFGTNEMGVIKAVTEFAIKNKLELNVNSSDWWFLK